MDRYTPGKEYSSPKKGQAILDRFRKHGNLRGGNSYSKYDAESSIDELDFNKRKSSVKVPRLGNNSLLNSNYDTDMNRNDSNLDGLSHSDHSDKGKKSVLKINKSVRMINDLNQRLNELKEQARANSYTNSEIRPLERNRSQTRNSTQELSKQLDLLTKNMKYTKTTTNLESKIPPKSYNNNKYYDAGLSLLNLNTNAIEERPPKINISRKFNPHDPDFIPKTNSRDKSEETD